MTIWTRPLQDNRGGADADTSPFLGPADVGSGVLPRDRFRRPSNAVAGAPQRPLVTPQHYAMAGALPPEPPAKAFPALSEGAARGEVAAPLPWRPGPRRPDNNQPRPPSHLHVLPAALAARVVELEERLRMVEASATRTQAMESRLMALERRAQGAEQGSRAAATAVDDEVRPGRRTADYHCSISPPAVVASAGACHVLTRLVSPGPEDGHARGGDRGGVGAVPAGVVRGEDEARGACQGAARVEGSRWVAT